jgi:hypothetical protein
VELSTDLIPDGRRIRRRNRRRKRRRRLKKPDEDARTL